MRRAALMVIALLALCVLTGVATYAASPLFREFMLHRDAQLITESFIAQPMIDGRTFLGESSAPVTIVVYVDPDASSTPEFLAHTAPLLLAYAENGTVRIYPRASLSLRDVHKATPRYERMRDLVCLSSGDSTAWLELLEGKALNTLPSFSDEEVQQCLRAGATDALWRDALETERLGAQALSPQLVIGIDGHDNELLFGVPSAQRLGREIRKLEIRIGE